MDVLARDGESWSVGVPNSYRDSRDSDGRLLRRHATWCGVVVALSVLFTTLNFFPPFPITYKVRSEAVISASRLNELEEKSRKDLEDLASGRIKPAQLVGLKVLDASSQAIEGPIPAEQDILLVEFNSVWSKHCSSDLHKKWLTAITSEPTDGIDKSEIAKQHRMAKWELEAAKHYRDRQEFLSDKAPLSTKDEDGKTFSLATTPNNKVSASFATYGRVVNEPTDAEESPELIASLDTDVRLASNFLEQTEHAWQQLIKKSSGLFQVASQPEIETDTRGIPVWMTLSILVVVTCSGASASWLYVRLQSAGGYTPNAIAQQLANEGIPSAGRISLPSEDDDSKGKISRLIKSTRSLGRLAACNLTKIGEFALGFWVLFIVLRLITDSMWRSVLVENPLAAFGRVIIGLP